MTVRVLLLWPGTDGAASGNFGVPQLVLLATYLRDKTGADVRIRDLVAERALGPVSLDRLLAADDGRGYDVIAFSVYSSFDWLKCKAIAEIAREKHPDAVIVAGGYHASARPTEIVRDGSPFDVCVVGEGERPMVRVVESVAGGAPLRGAILGPDAIDDLAELPPSDWTFLDRYRHVARRVASQAQVYFSRGCPFDCAFCMERAKREVSWRPLPVERALEEIRSLHTWTGSTPGCATSASARVRTRCAASTARSQTSRGASGAPCSRRSHSEPSSIRTTACSRRSSASHASASFRSTQSASRPETSRSRSTAKAARASARCTPTRAPSASSTSAKATPCSIWAPAPATAPLSSASSSATPATSTRSRSIPLSPRRPRRTSRVASTSPSTPPTPSTHRAGPRPPPRSTWPSR